MSDSDRQKGILYSEAATRNAIPLVEVLNLVLPAKGSVLEIASGSGQHIVAFAQAFPSLEWQPSDASTEALVSIRLRAEQAALPNLRFPVALDASRDDWPVARADVVFVANLFHIAPWETALSVLRGAAERLIPQGRLVVYGPFIFEGLPTAPSNVEFDQWLRFRNDAWGIRNANDVDAAAKARHLHTDCVFRMPANNYALVFSRSGSSF